ERTVLMIRRATKLYARHSLLPKLRFEFLHQARFAHPGLTAEQHHLTFPAFGPLPALSQQGEFFGSPHERRQAHLYRHLKATLRFTLADDSIHHEGGREAFQRL